MDLLPRTKHLLERTLATYLMDVELLFEDMAVITSIGKKLMRKKSGVLSSELQVLGALLSAQSQAMAALSQLQSWTETNGYAATLTISQVFESSTYGSAKLGELIEAHQLMMLWLEVADTKFEWTGVAAILRPEQD